MSLEYKDIFYYQEGKLLRKYSSGGKLENSEAGYLCEDGYVKVEINDKTTGAHRIIWELFNGPIPEGLEIDHIDRNRSNNLIENLRLFTRQQNCQHQGITKRNKSGFKGVSFHKGSNKWTSQININKKCYTIGYFDTIEEAAKAYEDVSLMTRTQL